MRWLGSFLLLTGWWMVFGENYDHSSDVTTVTGVLTTLNAVNPSAITSPPLTKPATTQIPPSKATVTQPTKQITTLNKNNNVASSPSSTAPSLSTPLSSTPPSSTPPSSATSAAAAAAAVASPTAIENTSSNAVATSATNPASTPANTNTTTPANTNTATPANTNTTPTNTNTTNPTNTNSTTTPAYEANITPSPSTNATELPNNASITLQTANSSTVTPKSPLSSSSSPSSSTFPSVTHGVSRNAATVNGTSMTPPSASEAASSSVTTASGAAAAAAGGTAGGDINTNNTNNRFDASTAKTATTQDASEGGVPIDDRGIDGGRTPPPSTARPSKTEAVTEPDSSDSGHQAAGAERPGGPRHNVRTVLLAVGCSCLVLLVSAMLLYSKRRTRNKSWYVHNDHQVLENPCYENGCHDNGGNSNGGCHDNPAMEAIAGGPSPAAAAAAADGWPDEAWGCDTGPPLRPPGRATPARVAASPSVGVDAWVVPLDNVSSGDDPLAGLMQDTRL
ncbi:uncharacterized protein LOC144729377 isoform X1 [Lampetra planeri]